MAVNLLTQTKAFIKKYDIPTINSEAFLQENHSADNTILLHLEEVEQQVYKDVRYILGYTEHPSYNEFAGWGMMFERDNGESFWCHINPDAWILEQRGR